VKPVIYPLKLQLKRVEVGDLQQALSFLGLTIAGEEKKNQRFGATTRAAVRQFQVGHKLPETGEVDEATALAINEELADRGARHRTWIRQRSSGPESAINYKRRRSVTVTRPSHFHALWMLPGGRGDCDYPTRDMLIKAETLTISRRINGATEGVTEHVVQPFQRDF
jgi:peptidoglycan hydrolase-like protein with peptidoglycan-binding domain